MAMLSLLVLSVSILGFSAWAVVSPWGLAGLNKCRVTACRRCSTRSLRPPPTTEAPLPD